ncbi:NusG domain II-containing protein [Serpentinicella sp. ANB-PHB4]|uniref:NusG domain II-containing protein n=1 Tax=Serpentinicella sp. ANB-PHB4 TaxID=3074076 RepID=UPI00285425F2|nr:NusG domain II-containing protein [Serpentinicella sp. ANB-PHB4]MDR5659709.1 NusG domain II-containing protein [Serpentinicella sp. ANB-PHB4]
MKIFTKADIALIVLIVILSASSIFAIPRLFLDESEAKEIVVNVDGQVIHRFPLVNSPESEIIEFPFTHDNESYTGRLEVKDGAVRLHRLSKDISPRSIHADMGWIQHSYQMIIALPVRLHITIEEIEDHEFDAISY